MQISEFYEHQFHNTNTFEKTKADILIYSNTNKKLEKILREFVEMQLQIQENQNSNSYDQMRETINQRMNETIFDEKYLNEKVNKISKKFTNKYEEIDGQKVY